MEVVVATHGYCFDGLASAVLFSRLHDRLRGGGRFTYRACGYGVHQQKPEQLLVGRENAILDYRFSRDPQLTWYFDHHRTAFRTDAEREAFARLRDDERGYFAADYSSCTKLIADIARDRFGVDELQLDGLVHWADRIDSASFDSPEAAVSRDHPVMQLVSVVERHGNDRFLHDFVPLLLEQPLIEVARSRRVQELYAPLGKLHGEFTERVRRSGERLGRVVLVDLTDAVVESVEKFVTYALYPDATYSVIVSRRPRDVGISVGYNPWSNQPRDVDVSALCARHGGGGHLVVGAVSFASEQLETARDLARALARELAG